MKFFSWLGTILIILLIIAAITAPGDQKFTDFINKDQGGDTMSCKPIIASKSTEIKLLVRVASVKYVSFCETGGPLRLKDKTGKTRTLSYEIPNITHSETYLGLFGRFWKL